MPLAFRFTYRVSIAFALAASIGQLHGFPLLMLRAEAQSAPPMASQAVPPPASSDQAYRDFKAGNVNAAIATWTRLIESGREVQDSLYNRAQAYIVIRQNTLALADLNRLEVLQRPSVDASTFMMRGIVHNELRDPTAALNDFSLSLRIRPSALAYANRALVYQRQGQLQLAERDLQTAVKMDPTHTNIFNLASIQRLLGDTKACVANTSTLIDFNPVAFYPAYTLRGICNYLSGSYDLALSDLLKSTTLERAQPQAFHYMGLVLTALNKRTEARQSLLKAADLYLASSDQKSYQQVMQLLSGSPAP